jgi:hypothetical protein
LPFVHRGGQAPLGTAALIAFVAVTLLGGVTFARRTPPITTVSDIAVIELYTDLATRGRLLVGPYSRFGWHHPGPLYFYLQAPLYGLSGHRAAALYAGALAINLGALMLLVFVISRENRGLLLVLVTAAAMVFVWRTPRLLASPWTAHVPVLPTVTLLALCAATVSRRPEWLPVTFAIGSFVVQTHVGFAPIVAALAIATAVGLVTGRHVHGGSLRPALIASALVCVLLWIVPIAEAVSHAGGNMTALWRFFASGGGQAHPLREAALAWSYGFAGVFRADWALPWGGHFVPAIPKWAVASTIAEVLLLPAIAALDFKAGRLFDGNLAIGTLLASLSGLWALTRVRDDILDHEIFWLAAFGLIAGAVIAAAALRVVHERLPAGKTDQRLAIALALLMLIAAAGMGVRDLRSLTTYELSRLDRPRIIAAHSSIDEYLRERGVRKPLIEIDAAVWSQAAGVLVTLTRDGTAFALPPDAQSMFTDSFAATGEEDAHVSIASLARHRQLVSRPGNTLVLQADPLYIDAITVRPVQIK